MSGKLVNSPAESLIRLDATGTDYFTVFGLPRKLAIDLAALEAAFHALSRRYHPDLFRLAAPRERMIALENSSLVNRAYRTLRDPFERTAYLLKLETADASTQKEAPPQALFAELLEVQELVGEFQLADDDEKKALRPQLEEKQRLLQEDISARTQILTETLFAEWDALAVTSHANAESRQALLERMRDQLAARAYLRRGLSGLDAALGTTG